MRRTARDFLFWLLVLLPLSGLMVSCDLLGEDEQPFFVPVADEDLTEAQKQERADLLAETPNLSVHPVRIPNPTALLEAEELRLPVTANNSLTAHREEVTNYDAGFSWRGDVGDEGIAFLRLGRDDSGRPYVGGYVRTRRGNFRVAALPGDLYAFVQYDLSRLEPYTAYHLDATVIELRDPQGILRDSIDVGDELFGSLVAQIRQARDLNADSAVAEYRLTDDPNGFEIQTNDRRQIVETDPENLNLRVKVVDGETGREADVMRFESRQNRFPFSVQNSRLVWELRDSTGTALENCDQLYFGCLSRSELEEWGNLTISGKTAESTFTLKAVVHEVAAAVAAVN